MTTKLNPYLNFRRQAREVMEFYQSVFGGELNVSTFGENGMEVGPDEQDLVMHSQLDTAGGLTLMGSDVPESMPFESGHNGGISLSGEDEAELTGYWEKLSDGARITMALDKAPWGDSFGMLTDKYGVDWLVNISGSPAS